MATWQALLDSEPEFAERVRVRFSAGKHKTLATIRKDGAPRISGIEAEFAEGQLWLGMMAKSQKLRDVQRDPRIALHAPSTEPPEDPAKGAEWSGDAKLAGSLIVMDDALRQRIAEGLPPGDYFTVDIQEVVLTRVAESGEHLVIELWRPGQPIKTMQA